MIGLPASQARPATERMARAMVHRGPDDEGFEWAALTADHAGPVAAFGFRRLAILDISPAGHQPMVNRTTGDVLSFNGEIYNFRELRSRLEAKGRQFRSTGDTEVVLHALAEWGEDAFEQFDGMFAIAFYRAVDRRVLLGRDPLGIKPLYVAATPGAFVFASEVRAVLASGLVATELDPTGIATFLAYGAPQDPLTVHRFVRSLPAGAFEWIGLEEARGRPPAVRRYWRFPKIDSGVAADQPASVRTRELLADSIRRQCIADVPVGVFLSAGIDSSTIAALAQPQHGAVSTFSVGFEAEGPVDESALAAETAAVLGTQHCPTIIDSLQAVEQFLAWLSACDRPSIDGLNTFIVSGAAKNRGITVALAGIGADEIFGGYPIFSRAARLERFIQPLKWLPRGVRRAAARVAVAALPAIKREKAAEMIVRGASPYELAIFARRLMLDGPLHRLGFDADRLGLTADYLPEDVPAAFDRRGDCFTQVSEIEISLYMRNTLLRDADVNSMAHSLEVRVPFLGQRLVNYVCSLPGAVRSPANSQPKHVLREAMKDSLPPAVFSRPKTGFTLPIDAWIRGELRDACCESIDYLANCSFLDSHAVQGLWREFEAPRGVLASMRRLSLIVLGNYLRSVNAA